MIVGIRGESEGRESVRTGRKRWGEIMREWGEREDARVGREEEGARVVRKMG